MLTPAELELLTAAIDGELDARQQRRLDRLLVTSPEARQIHDRLQHDAGSVRGLPKRSCPGDLTGAVLGAVANLPRRSRRTAPVVPETPVGVPAWFGLAIAASVLFIMGITSYLYFAASVGRVPGPGAQPTDFAQQNPNPEREPERGPVVVQVPLPTPDPMQPELRPMTVELPKTPDPERQPEIEPEPMLGSIFTDRFNERTQLRTVEPTFPTIHKVQGLEKPRWTDELGKATAFRLEMPTRDANKTVERFQSILKSQNLQAVVDGPAALRLPRPQLKSSFLVLLEDITPDELTALVEVLAEADRKPDNKKSVDPVLAARLVLSRQNKLDQRDLFEHLGIDLPVLAQPKTTGPLGIDPTRPIADQTADEIDRKLNGGKLIRPALVLAYGTTRLTTPSVEVKKYLESRKPVRPGALQVMLVFRNVG